MSQQVQQTPRATEQQPTRTQPVQSRTTQPQSVQTEGYRPSYRAQTPVGQQLQTGPMGQAIGQRFQESLPQEIHQIVMDLERFETITEWVKSRASERGMPRVAARADDLANIAHLRRSC